MTEFNLLTNRLDEKNFYLLDQYWSTEHNLFWLTLKGLTFLWFSIELFVMRRAVYLIVMLFMAKDWMTRCCRLGKQGSHIKHIILNQNYRFILVSRALRPHLLIFEYFLKVSSFSQKAVHTTTNGVVLHSCNHLYKYL